jgi:hypothetical protein
LRGSTLNRYLAHLFTAFTDIIVKDIPFTTYTPSSWLETTRIIVAQLDQFILAYVLLDDHARTADRVEGSVELAISVRKTIPCDPATY